MAPGPLCALPSTVQSAIALTSIAQGNVAGAVCAATASSLIGLLLTPLLFGFMSHLYGGAIDVFGMWKILGELLAPFVVGHLLRPWIGAWAARNRSVLAVATGARSCWWNAGLAFLSALGVSWRRG